MSHSFRLALLDLDGTLYRGEQVIDGAPEFVQRLIDQGIQPVYFTNNSTRTPQQVAHHLKGMGFPCEPDDVCTSAQSAARMVKVEVPAGSDIVYLGMEGLCKALREDGLNPLRAGSDEEVRPAAAVLGLCTDVTYSELASFCQQVMRLERFYITNADLRLPVDGGFWPGNGAFGALVSATTGISAIGAGKPESAFIDYALLRYGGRRDTTVIIGDNLLTDIAAGQRAGIYSIHVNSGVLYIHEPSTTDGHPITPDESYPTVSDIKSLFL